MHALNNSAANFKTSSVPVGPDPTLLVPVRIGRVELSILVNKVPIFIGPDASVTPETGFPLSVGYTRDFAIVGEIWAVTESETAVVNLLETF